MRLYSKTGATQVDDPEFGTFTPDANGAFDGLPDAMYAKLHGRPGWENDAERERRVTAEELEKFRDPAELLKAVKELGANQGLLTAALAQALGLAPQPGTPAPPGAAPAPGAPAPAGAATPADASARSAAADAPAPAVKSRSRKAAVAPSGD